MMEFEEDYEDEGDDGFILFSGNNGKSKIIKKEDYENKIEKQQEIIIDFIKENTKLFSKFLKKKGISEDDFNLEENE